MQKLTVAVLVAVGALGLAACDRGADSPSNRVGQVRPGQASQDQARQAAPSPGSQSTAGANGPPTTGAGGPPSPGASTGHAADSTQDPRTAQVSFDVADTDKDGALSRSEAGAILVSDSEFSRADADRNSKLDRQEFTVATAGDRPRG